MFIIAILAILPAFLVVADVTPSAPGPGYVANAGSQCGIEWIGDTSSSTVWKGMSIQLMTGDNFNMIPLTTVVQNLDGTKSGSFMWTCPQVTPNSAIYFYQFTSPNTVNRQWTTRFAIASSSGQTTPPPNVTQPGTGQAIPWGIGKLNDPSKAVPPPGYLTGGSTPSPPASSTSGNPTSTNPGTSSTTASVNSTPSSSLSPSTSTTLTGAGLTTTPLPSTTVVITQATATTTPSASIPSTSTNSAAPYTPFVPGLLLSICAPVFMALF